MKNFCRFSFVAVIALSFSAHAEIAELRNDRARIETSEVSAPATAVGNASLTALRDGSILSVGGFTAIADGAIGGVGSEVSGSALLFSSDANGKRVIAPAAAKLLQKRAWHTATLLKNGKVLVVGGIVTGGLTPTAVLASCELYDPTTKKFTAAASMKNARAEHSAVLLSDGRVLVAGGLSNGSSTDSAEIYDPTTNRWSVAASMATGLPAASAASAKRRFAPMVVLPSTGEAIIAGGGNFNATAEAFNPKTGKWRALGSLQEARYGHSLSVLVDGSVLAVGGYGATLLASTERYVPSLNKWQTGPALATARYFHSATTVSDGRILVLGGVQNVEGQNPEGQNTEGKSSAPNLSSEAEWIDAKAKTITAGPEVTTAFRFQRAVALPKSGVLVVGASGADLNAAAAAR